MLGLVLDRLRVQVLQGLHQLLLEVVQVLQVLQVQQPHLVLGLALDRLLVQVLQGLHQLQQLEELVLEVELETHAWLELEVQPGSGRSSTPAKFRLP